MAKEWILNSAMNRFQLNFKRNVGAVAFEIRKCEPKSLEEWKEYYYQNVRSKDHIDELGRKLYVKCTEVIRSEVDEVSEEDCIAYLHEVVIDRTYDGYNTEIETIYGQLEKQLNAKIEAAPDEWDRLFNVDFFIQIGTLYIGLQIKPVNDVSHISQIFKEREIQANTHAAFSRQYGGQVFYIFSEKRDKVKRIVNVEVIEAIKCEISRLQKRDGK